MFYVIAIIIILQIMVILYNNYAIIDDDSDMLLWQKDNFFQTDSYSGLTPTTCYKIKNFFMQKQNP